MKKHFLAILLAAILSGCGQDQVIVNSDSLGATTTDEIVTEDTFDPIADTTPIDYNANLVSRVGTSTVVNFYSTDVNYLAAAPNTFARIDTSLIEVEETATSATSTLLGAGRNFDGWKMEKASYHAKIPRYADEWATFKDFYKGKKNVVKLRAYCDKVEGTKTGNNEVTYFGACQGHDLIYTAMRSGLQKKIKIKRSIVSGDIRFKFDYDVPGKIRTKNKKNGTVSNFNKTTKTVFKDVEYYLSSDDNPTMFEKMIMWGDDGSGGTKEASLSVEFDKKTFTKIIEEKSLNDFYGDVFVDTTTSFSMVTTYSGELAKVNTTGWSSCRDATSASYINSFNSTRAASHCNGSNNYTIYRSSMEFNTAAIGSGEISSATLWVYVTGKQDTDNDGQAIVNVFGSTKTPGASVVVDDYGKTGGTEFSTSKDITAVSTTAWSSFALNASGISAINKSGGTVLSMKEGHDYLNSAVSCSYKYSEISVAGVLAESSLLPYLSVEYTSGGGSRKKLIITN